MLHYYVKYFNLDKHPFDRATQTEEIAGIYFKQFYGNYRGFFDTLGYNKKQNEEIIIDTSNGVGGKYINYFIKGIATEFNAQAINTNEIKFLNDSCGAEYVHK